MTLRAWGRLHQTERGFTLIEILVAIAIVGIITGGITATISQVFNVNQRASNHMLAVRQVQQAGDRLSKDTLQAQAVNLTPEEIHPSRFPLTLTWTAWDGEKNTVTYTLEDMPSGSLKMLRRSHTVTPVGGDPITTVSTVAEYIYTGGGEESTRCEPAAGVLTFTITARVGSGPRGASETRVYQAEPRPTQP